MIYARDLTEGQAKAYRIADNKVGESSEWVEELLGKELEAILLEAPQIEPADFGFTSGAEIRRRKSWENAGKRCGTDPDIRIREKNGFLYTSFFTTDGEGTPIDEMKKAVDRAGKTVRDQIRGSAPVRTGKYAKSWTARKTRETAVALQVTVYSPSRYMLAHLLEHGHAKRNGGRTRAFPHIAPAEAAGEEQLTQDIMRGLQNG